jgi:hypothetical protein
MRRGARTNSLLRLKLTRQSAVAQTAIAVLTVLAAVPFFSRLRNAGLPAALVVLCAMVLIALLGVALCMTLSRFQI